MSTTPTTCPHCGAEEVKQLLRNWSGWSCGTHGPTGAPDLVTIKPPCYERQIATLKAELEQAKAERQWRPIETAPKDGSWFVTVDREFGIGSAEVGCYQPLTHTVYAPVGDGLFRAEEKTLFEWTGFSNIHRATHWFPLLPAPKEAQP